MRKSLFDTFFHPMVTVLHSMTTKPLGSIRWMAQLGIIAGLVAVLFVLAPFAVAQDVHHELAAADTDGHEHSDHDLCQWVQQHTSGSVDLGGPIISAWELVHQYDIPPQSVLLSAEFAPFC